MHSLPILSELPRGFFVEEAPRGILAVSIEVARSFHEARFGPESDAALVQSDLVGRRPLLELDVGGQRFVVRRFSHGGCLRWITGERYLDAARPFRELILAHRVAAWGLPTPAPVAARARLARGGGWLLETVSPRIEGTLDLGRVLRLMHDGPLPHAVRRNLFGALGRFLREMHRHGLLHADLTPSNLLVQADALRGEPPRLWLVDLEGSRIRIPLDFRRCKSNLCRMYRHVERRVREGEARVTRTDLLRVLRAYEPSRAGWKAYWCAIASEHRRTRPWHGLGRLLERTFAAGRRVGQSADPGAGAGPTRG